MGISGNTLALASGVFSTAGAVSSSYAAYSKSKTEQLALNAQSATAERNAQALEADARDATRRGTLAEARRRGEGARAIGTQRASLAARGIDLGASGSLDSLGDIYDITEVDALMLRDNAARESYSIQRRADTVRGEGRAAGVMAGAIRPVGSAASTLLGSSGTVAQGWYRYADETKKQRERDEAAAAANQRASYWW
jgi:hypothetical protein